MFVAQEREREEPCLFRDASSTVVCIKLCLVKVVYMSYTDLEIVNSKSRTMFS